MLHGATEPEIHGVSARLHEALMSEQSYLVTARKYRPQIFSDVVAQKHITDTLKNAIRMDRLAHAYLFTGPRGVGKTTVARILAKAVNCTTPPEERPDRSEPCRTCVSCKTFEEGRNLNIFEIDAASNNKVDDVRDLRETVRIPPQGARMKVYIIDEVHMLSNAAFNALLKTLEEPPPHALFIFATTEPHKVIPTIQSRCQRFDFRRIAVLEIISRLTEICEDESITTDEASLMLIARKGDGALRDALSVFDQSVSLCGTNLVYDDLIQALGVVDSDVFFQVTDAAAEGDVGQMIRIVDQIVRSGYDLQEFLDGLSEHLRNMLVLKTVGDPSLLEVTSQVRERYTSGTDRFTSSVILRYVHIAGETADSLRTTRQPRLKLEMALLKMASLPSALDIRSALEKLDRIESLVQSSGLQTETRTATSKKRPEEALPRTPAPATSTAEVKVDTQGVSGPAAKPTPVPASELKTDIEPPREKQSTPTEEDSSTPTDEEKESSSPDPAPAPEPDPAVTSTGPPSAPVRSEPAPAQGTLTLGFDKPALKRRTPPTDNALLIPPSGDPTLTQTNPESSSTIAVLASPDTLVSAWNQVVSEVMETQIRLGSVLRQTTVLSVEEEHVLVGVPDDFHERMLRNERSQLARHLAEVAGVPVADLTFKITEDLPSSGEHPGEDPFDAREFLKQKSKENPAVQLLVERFGGEIVW